MKQTKIVATISDLRCDKEFLKTLYDSGVNVFRTNTAHQQPEDTLKIINNVRSIAKDAAVLIDTKGPEIRTGKVEAKLDIKTGMIVKMGANSDVISTVECIQTNYKNFVKDVPVGQHITIDDGELALVVEKKDKDFLYCKALNNALLGGKKTINLPGLRLDLPNLIPKDLEYVKMCGEMKVDFLAHSFVRRAENIQEIKDLFKKYGNTTTKIIAKIENQEGVDNLEEIMDVADGVMVARGDLAMEIPAWEVPIVQKRMIQESIKRGKPVITATQMLHTMIKNPRPTRAEISDIANAVYDGSDALMLSGETANGDFPFEAVKYMANTIKNVEKNLPKFVKNGHTQLGDEIQQFFAKAAIEATHELPIKAIVTATEQGGTARLIASYRPRVPIYAKCAKEETARILSLTFGVSATYVPGVMEDPESKISDSVRELVAQEKLKKEDLVLFIGTTPKDKFGPEFIEIKTVEEFLSQNPGASKSTTSKKKN